MDDKLKQAIDRRLAGAALSEASKARMIQIAVKGTENQSARTRKRKMILTAAAVAAVMVSGCFAVQVIHDNIRQTMTSWEETHEGTPLHLSQSDAGYTVALDEIYGDTVMVYIKGTVSRDDGTPWRTAQYEGDTEEGVSGARVWFEEQDFEIPGYTEQMHQLGKVWKSAQYYFLIDANPDDNKQEFIMSLSAQEFPLDGTITVLFQGLRYWEDAAGTQTHVVDGTWRFTVPVAREDTGETLAVGRSVQTAAGTVRLDTLHFSALDVSAEWSGANETLFEGDKENTYLLLKSGEKLPYQNRAIDHADGTRIFMKFWNFNKGLGHISADDVQAVVFAGQEIPIA